MIDEKTARASINECLAKIREYLNKATDIADQSGVSFTFNECGYGMGGRYEPKPRGFTKEEAIARIESGETISSYDREAIVAALKGENSDDWDDSGYGWQSSSQGC